METIKPHGGVLVNREAGEGEREALTARASSLPTITLDERQISDLEMIAIGAFSPLDGFMGRADYTARRRAACASPTACPGRSRSRSRSSRRRPRRSRDGERGRAHGRDGHLLAVMHVDEHFDVRQEARGARRSTAPTDEAHPGVAAVYAQGDVLLGGPITLLNRPQQTDVPRVPPRRRRETRAAFAERGWKTVVGLPDAQPDPPRARVHPEVRAGDRRRPAAPPAGRRRPRATTSRPTCAWSATRRCSSDYYPADRVLLAVLPGGDALRRPARGDLPRAHAQELRLHALHRRPRPRRRRQLLRHLRRAATSSTSSRRTSSASRRCSSSTRFFCRACDGMASARPARTARRTTCSCPARRSARCCATARCRRPSSRAPRWPASSSTP